MTYRNNSQNKPAALVTALYGSGLADGRALSTAAVLGVLGELGVPEAAVRAALARMVGAGRLVRHRVGRSVYYSVSAPMADDIADARAEIATFAGPDRWSPEQWTLLVFTQAIEDRGEWRRIRHDLEYRHFGQLQHRTWIASGPRREHAIIDRLEARGGVLALPAAALEPSSPGGLAANAFDLPAARARITEFTADWGGGDRRSLPAAAQRTLLHLEWLLVARRDPRLPQRLLEQHWPARIARALFERVRDEAEAQGPPALESVLVDPHPADRRSADAHPGEPRSAEPNGAES